MTSYFLLDLDLTICSDWCHRGASDITGGGSERGFYHNYLLDD